MDKVVLVDILVVLTVLYLVYDSFRNSKEDMRKTNKRNNYVIITFILLASIIIMPFWIGIMFFSFLAPLLIILFKYYDKQVERIWDSWFKKDE